MRSFSFPGLPPFPRGKRPALPTHGSPLPSKTLKRNHRPAQNPHANPPVSPAGHFGKGRVQMAGPALGSATVPTRRVTGRSTQTAGPGSAPHPECPAQCRWAAGPQETSSPLGHSSHSSPEPIHSFTYLLTHSFSNDGKRRRGWRAQADPKGPRVSTARNSRSLLPGRRNEQCHPSTAGAPTAWPSSEIECRGLCLGL